MNIDFGNWLRNKIDEYGYSYSEVGRRGGTSHTRVSQIVNGDKPGWDFCLAIAKAFNIPPHEVMEEAGLLKKTELTQMDREVLFIMNKLSDQEKEVVLKMLRGLL